MGWVGSKAQNASNVGELARFYNAADRRSPRASRLSQDFEWALLVHGGRWCAVTGEVKRLGGGGQGATQDGHRFGAAVGGR